MSIVSHGAQWSFSIIIFDKFGKNTLSEKDFHLVSLDLFYCKLVEKIKLYRCYIQRKDAKENIIFYKGDFHLGAPDCIDAGTCGCLGAQNHFSSFQLGIALVVDIQICAESFENRRYDCPENAFVYYLVGSRLV